MYDKEFGVLSPYSQVHGLIPREAKSVLREESNRVEQRERFP